MLYAVEEEFSRRGWEDDYAFFLDRAIGGKFLTDLQKIYFAAHASAEQKAQAAMGTIEFKHLQQKEQPK